MFSFDAKFTVEATEILELDSTFTASASEILDTYNLGDTQLCTVANKLYILYN